jgi:deazaflavin-dependent oxidoreductase (nitroreductase family)
MLNQVASRPPAVVRLLSPLAQRLMSAGLRQGPNALITIRGRKSGVSRTTGVTIVEAGKRRYVIGTFGDTNWVRNLRAAGEATLTIGRRSEQVRAVELIGDDRTAFFRDVLGPYVRRMRIAPVLLRILGATEILNDPAAAGERRPVFALTKTADSRD